MRVFVSHQAARWTLRAQVSEWSRFGSALLRAASRDASRIRLIAHEMLARQVGGDKGLLA